MAADYFPEGSAPEPGALAGKAPRRGGFKRWLFLTLATVAGCWYGWHWWQQRQMYEATDDAQLAADLVPVTSEIAGRVSAVDVEEHEEVAAGQLLVELDARPYEIAVHKAEAALHVAERQAAAAKAGVALSSSQASAQMTQADGGVSQAAASTATAESQVVQAEFDAKAAQDKLDDLQARLDLAQAQYERYADLAARGYVSQLELDTARTARDSAKAQLAAGQKDLQSAQAKVAAARSSVEQAKAREVQSQGLKQGAQAATLQTTVTAAQYDTAEAQVELARAALEEAQLHLEQTRLTAAVAGRVGRRAVQPGQEVSPGQSLLAIVPPRMWVEANFKETQVRRMLPGQAVDLRVDALPHTVFHGKVASLAPASGATFSLIPPENASGNFTKVVQRIPVRVELDESQIGLYKDLLAPGMSVLVKVKVL